MADPVIDASRAISAWAIERDVVINAMTHWRSKFKGALRHHATGMGISSLDGEVHHHTVTVVLTKENDGG